MTIHERVAAAREQLRAAGVAEAEADLDARLLAEHLLGWDAARYFTDGGTAASPTFRAAYDALVARRAAREPVAYIVGRQEFWGLAFGVSPAVLIPRPETELIIEAALETFPSADADLRIVDVCTGSGCVAVALARERPRARLLATELSETALEVARDNAARHDVDRRIEFRHTNLLDGIEGLFDLVVSNPPYVPDRERSMLQPEVREHEPAMALFAGPDGLDVIRRLTPAAADRLRPNGLLIFEFGFGQDQAVEELIAETTGLTLVALRCDLQGIPRTAVARRT